MGILNLTPGTGSIGDGSASQIVLGTGNAVPGGIESTFQYRTLLMNERTWLDAILITEVDGLSDADIRDQRADNPSAHGETAFTPWYGGRTITLTGRIRAQTFLKMRDMVESIHTAFADIQNEYPLVINPGRLGPAIQINCRKNQPLVMREVQSDTRFIRDFQITLRASNPRFISLVEDYVSIVMTSSPASGVVTNDGNFFAQPKIQISGPITSPVIRNNTTNQTMKLNVALGQETWTIDTAKRTILSGTGLNRFDAFDVTSDWIELRQGSNLMQMSGLGITSGSTGLFVYHNETWM